MRQGELHGEHSAGLVELSQQSLELLKLILYKKVHPGDSKISHSEFTEAVAKDLLINRASTWCKYTENSGSLPHDIVPLSSLPYYMARERAVDSSVGKKPSRELPTTASLLANGVSGNGSCCYCSDPDH